MAQNTNTHWRDSALTPKFYCFDGRVSLSVLLFFMHMRYWTLGIVIFLFVVSSILNYFRMPLIVAYRIMKHWLTGNRKAIFRQE